ncbi:MAG: transposase, partial [Halanaerobiales bacterium]|nr:transposase [Halanaerobiales bacterium]
MNAKEGIDEKELVKIARGISTERGEAIMTIAEKLRMEEKLAIAKNMLEMGMDIEQIMKATKVKEEKLQILKEEIKH